MVILLHNRESAADVERRFALDIGFINDPTCRIWLSTRVPRKWFATECEIEALLACGPKTDNRCPDCSRACDRDGIVHQISDQSL